MTRKFLSLLSFLLFHRWFLDLQREISARKTVRLLEEQYSNILKTGDVLLKRSKDLQLFRINLEIFTEDDQAFVKNNFPPNHDALPEFQRPLYQTCINDKCEVHR